jgi:transcriptional regulator with XRE-family HTH domain
MGLAPTTNKTASSPAGVLLRQWRDIRGKSQLDLSLDAGVSQRHISFVESGRSTPSRQMLLDLAQALEVPLRERNALLLAAGYAPIYADTALDEPAMKAVNKIAASARPAMGGREYLYRRPLVAR